jgi:hypothetical protein
MMPSDTLLRGDAPQIHKPIFRVRVGNFVFGCEFLRHFHRGEFSRGNFICTTVSACLSTMVIISVMKNASWIDQQTY